MSELPQVVQEEHMDALSLPLEDLDLKSLSELDGSALDLIIKDLAEDNAERGTSRHSSHSSYSTHGTAVW